MAVEALKSQSITNLDTLPVVPNSAGQGATGRFCTVDDSATPTVSGLGSIGSTYRLVRIPTSAIIKSLIIATDKVLDTNATNTLAFDLNVAFSDGTLDGTPTFLQGLVPTTANNGATTTFAAYVAPNKLFGTLTAAMLGRTVQYGPTDLVFNGAQATYDLAVITQEPLWQVFGFVNVLGNPADPGGYFDIVAYVATAAATAVSGNLYARAAYVF